MERSLENNTYHQNFSDIWNNTEEFSPVKTTRILTSISFGVGICIIVLNATTLFLLIRHRKYIDGNGFWQQLLFLCSSDILSGVAVALPYCGKLLIAMHADIYYVFCTIGLILLQLSTTLSLGNCFMISVLRYMIMKNIDNPVSMWYKHVTYFMIVGNVLLCALMVCSSVLVVTIQYGFQSIEFCDKVNTLEQSEYKFKYIIGGLFILVVFLFGTNILAVLCIQKVRTANMVQIGSSSSEANRRATITFILIVAALDICTIPGMLFFGTTMNTSVDVSAEVTEIMSRLIALNSLCNPFIYSLRSTKFRSAVWNDTCIRKICKARRNSSNGTV